jgi:excisionase family DNA binding protein
MTTDQAAALLCVRPQYVVKLVRARKLRASRIGKNLRILGTELQRFMLAQPSHDEDGHALGADGQPLPAPPSGHPFGRTSSTSPEQSDGSR